MPYHGHGGRDGEERRAGIRADLCLRGRAKDATAQTTRVQERGGLREMERFVLTSLDPPPNHTNTCKICLKNLVSVWSIKIFFFHRQSGEGPEPETDAGRPEKGGSPG